MTKRENKTSARASRPPRTPIQGVRAKLGSLECTLANLSSSGAMLLSRLQVPVGREGELQLELSKPVSVRVCVVRCDPVAVALPDEAVWRRQEYALGIHFLEGSSDLSAAIRTLTRQSAERIDRAIDETP
jgi:hypothetical protein